MSRFRFIAVLLLISVAVTQADELSSNEKAVWQLEEAYWEFVQRNDIPGYRSLWDDRFTGWPGFSRTPVGKADIHKWIAQYHDDDSEYFDYELTMASVRAYGDVVAAHYLVRFVMRTVETSEMIGEPVVSRITHTWQRRGDTWQIVSGMSGTLVVEEASE